jgi:hypothetical protein
MPAIEVNDKVHVLKPGQTRVGAGPGVEISVSDDATLGVQAVLELGGDSAVVIRRAREGATVRVNGVALGIEPTPLIHGDKVEISGIELTYADDKKVGATQFVSKSDVAAAAAKRAGSSSRATSGTGGRIVSLVDGKEYQIPSEGVTFGREAGSDVVVAQPEVSRRHASIAPGPSGYVIRDHSTNGIWVNGTRVQGSQLLARADVVRVGSEEFRFYADVAPVRPTPAASSLAQSAAPPVAQASAAPPPAAPPAAAPPRPSAPPVPQQRPASAASKASAASAHTGSRGEPTTAPKTIPSGTRQKKQASGANKEEKRSGGIPAWLWVVILTIVGVVAYVLGQGQG